MTIYELYDKVIAGEKVDLSTVTPLSKAELSMLANALGVNLKKLADFKTGLIAGMNL